jgi:hypothetical protein
VETPSLILQVVRNPLAAPRIQRFSDVPSPSFFSFPSSYGLPVSWLRVVVLRVPAVQPLPQLASRLPAFDIMYVNAN